MPASEGAADPVGIMRFQLLRRRIEIESGQLVTKQHFRLGGNVGNPWIGPFVARRTIEASLDVPVPVDIRLKHEHTRVAQRAGAGRGGVNRNEEQRRQAREKLLILRPHAPRLNEIGPGNIVVFRNPPLIAGVHERQCAVQEEFEFIQRNAREPGSQALKEPYKVVQNALKVGREYRIWAFGSRH